MSAINVKKLLAKNETYQDDLLLLRSILFQNLLTWITLSEYSVQDFHWDNLYIENKTLYYNIYVNNIYLLYI